MASGEMNGLIGRVVSEVVFTALGSLEPNFGGERTFGRWPQP